MKKNRSVFLLVLCAALLGVVLYLMFRERYETGDVHPAYSSLRADPRGAMVLYESLSRLPRVKVERDYSRSNRLPEGPDTTYLQLASRSWAWEHMDEETLHVVEYFVLNGGRMVVLFDSDSLRFSGSSQAEKDKAKEKEKEEKSKKAEKDQPKKKATPRKILEEDEDPDDKTVDLGKRWGFKLEGQSVKASDDGKAATGAARNVSGLPLPETIKWNKGGVLKDLDSSWKAIYQDKGATVVAVKAMGKGSLVFATDALFTTNEAMADDRQADFLAWLVGGNHRVVFDEAHLGIVEHPGLASLARKYRLHGVAVALLILAGLFIWKNSLSLVPTRSASDRDLYVPGKDSAAGFAALLRRNIAPGQLLSVCLGEWNKTQTGSRQEAERAKAAIAAILQEEEAKPSRAQDPVKTYQRITAALDRRRKTAAP